MIRGDPFDEFMEDSRRRRQSFHDHHSRERGEFALFWRQHSAVNPPSDCCGLVGNYAHRDTTLRMAVKNLKRTS